MAIYPCDVGSHRHKTKNILVYSSLLSGDGDSRSRVRLCEGHWRAIEPDLVHYEVADDGTATRDPLAAKLCATCSEPLEERGRQLFVTSYPTKDERKDYWLQIHGECRVPVWMPWRAQDV